MRNAVGIVVATALLVGCRDRMKGKLELVAEGHQLQITNAFLVPTSTESFRVQFSTGTRDCEWARQDALGPLQKGETIGWFDIANVVALDGTWHWNVVGLGWNADRHATSLTMGNVGNVAWPVDVSHGWGHIGIKDAPNLRGDFDPKVCGQAPSTTSTTMPAPMMVKLAGKSFPLSRAWARRRGDGWLVRLSDALTPCTYVITGAAVFIDIGTDLDFRRIESFLAGGLVIPDFGFRAGAAPTVSVNRTADAVMLDGTFDSRPWDGAGTLPIEAHGEVPLTVCPGAERASGPNLTPEN